MHFFPSKKWRTPLILWGLMVIELALTIPILALFGIAAPDLYRTKLWQEGADQGFNSDPKAGLYAAANYRSYKTPLIWSQFLTNFNLVASVLGLFLLLTKGTMHVLHAFVPVISVIVHSALVGVYAYSVYGQSSKDLSDPRHPQKGLAWYITKDCKISSYNTLKGYYAHEVG
ncbi:hypothetical protein P152DRAFT_183826 [Eremomyces bilateralis CBS 781.70]|uniref:Uncharacterized protein n=1 Tax=Eremomyces bilateralis CBS 781.70 TaxID=1392243 RepID=A0A6G1GBR4_9PEZI|nr:uncharacterized protein P152DRAFT_183826 [Eremomyces bilateralis CBS 781.70]KAF1815386.1 hypothetical protein P152DRAFT_183826 [Eremomyces bilateralis CBS 781.70]